MKALHQALHQSLGEVPLRLLSTLVDSKLRSQGIRLSKRTRDRLARSILSGKVDNLQIDGRHKRLGSSNFSLEFTDADSQWMDQRFQRFLQHLPISAIADDLSRRLLATLKRGWPREYKRQQEELEGFRHRLDKRWGNGLQKLRMLICIAREYGSDVNVAVGAAGTKAFGVLIRLHARSCQVATEIVCLLENGLADGAMARWRTLQEITAVSHFILRYGNEAAVRYEDHQIVESRKAALQFQRYAKQLKQRPIPKKTLDKLESAYQSVLVKHGPDFANIHGWASKHIGKKNPTIADLQEAAGIEHLGPYYRMASHNVHANPKSIFFRLGHVGESATLLAGPTNAGMADPGHATAISLVQISAALIHFEETLDNLIVVSVMHSLEREVGLSLLAAHKKLGLDVRRLEESAKRRRAPTH